MKTIPTMQSMAYCWHCRNFYDPDELVQSWRAAGELVCPDCREPVTDKYQP